MAQELRLTAIPADIVRQFASWRRHPSRMVRELFGVTPDPWQHEALEAFPHNQRIALKASKGLGKTSFLAWVGWNFLLTRQHPKIRAVSVSADQLASGLWTEMAVWREKSPLLKEMFQFTKTRIFAKDYPETWWMEARSYSKTANRQEQQATLAGLHSDNIMVLLDESGGMSDAIMASAEAVLSSCVEGHIVQAGNPTHLQGPLYRACTQDRKNWHVIDINGDPDNPQRSPRIDPAWARKMIETYGRNDPFVRVDVFGQFPEASINALIGPDEMMDATRRSYHEAEIATSPRVLGVDVARYGMDKSVMWPRQGLVAMIPSEWRQLDGIQGAGAVARKWADWDADACFVDDTGGFGSSWIDNLRLLGRSPIPIAFSQSPNSPRFFNKRAEMYWECAQWIKSGGQLPPVDVPGVKEVIAAMTQTSYTHQGERLLLEPKDTVKEKIGYSPDHADALALTWGQPVFRRSKRSGGQMEYEYDPYANFARAAQRGAVQKVGMHANFDPYD